MMLLSKFFSTHVKNINLLFYRLFLFLLFLVVGFRHNVGCDWGNYKNLFDYQHSLSLAAMAIKGEIGFVGLTKIIQYFNLTFTYLNVASALIFFFGLNVLAKRQKDPLTFLILAFPILIILLPMSGVRQGVAVGILCIALVCFMDKKLFKYLALVALATTFHTSSIVFLGLAPFVNSNFSFKRIFIAMLLLSPLLFLESVASNLSIYSARYLESDMDSTGAIFRVGILVVTSLYFFFFLRKKWEKSYPEDYQLVLIGSIAMLLCFSILALSTVVSDRLAMYLIPFQLIILSRIQFFPSKYRRLASIFPFVLLFSAFFVWAEFSVFFDQCYSPYAIKFL